MTRLMFQIEINFKTTKLTGYEALDWRRSHNFYDSLEITINGDSKQYYVSEAFARKWFLSHETCPSVTISLAQLKTGDVVLCKDDRFAKVDISQERAEELFVESRQKRAEEIFDDVVDFKISRPGKVWTLPSVDKASPGYATRPSENGSNEFSVWGGEAWI